MATRVEMYSRAARIERLITPQAVTRVLNGAEPADELAALEVERMWEGESRGTDDYGAASDGGDVTDETGEL